MANHIGHIELTTSDPGKAKEFYGKLFGWSFEEYPMSDGGTYAMFRPSEGPPGGVMKSPPGVPTAWTTYVIVDDVNRATEEARSLGASVMREVTPIPGYGAFSIIADPTGGVFGLFSGE